MTVIYTYAVSSPLNNLDSLLSKGLVGEAIQRSLASDISSVSSSGHLYKALARFPPFNEFMQNIPRHLSNIVLIILPR